jgi:taurine dioxygenase
MASGLAKVGASAVWERPAPEGFGAELGGVDLAGGLSDAEAAATRTALARHAVIWFRDQPLTHPQLEALSLQLGAFGREPYAAPLPGHPHILEVRREPRETVAVFGGGWHSDWSFLETPPATTLLHAKIIPPVGGDTLFADGTLAWEALDGDRQRALEGLRGLHSASGPYGPEGYFAKETGRIGMTIHSSPDADGRISHPLVRTHPVTGRKSLFISPGYTIGIEGMDPGESRPLLDSLFAHMTQDRFVLRHRWAADTLTIWDNRRVLHHATGGYDGHRRVLHRTTLVGERPV